MNRDIIRKAVDAAALAPSGHNYQPWRFEAEGDVITFYNLPGNDRTIYNFKQRGSYIGHGAAIENALAALEAEGYTAEVEVEAAEGSDRIACLRIRPGSSGRGFLSRAVRTRTSNRKPYDTQRIEGLSDLADIPADLARSGKAVFVEDRETIRKLAAAFTVNDWLLFNARPVHDALFPHLIWDREEERERREGLFIDTLELPPPVRGMFNILRFWPVAKAFGSIGFGSVAAKQNADTLYSRCGAIGAILVPDLTPINLVHAGRILEFVWLCAALKGLSVQMVMGAYYLSLRMQENAEGFAPYHKEKLAIAKETLTDAFPDSSMIPAVFFRIGKSEPPTALSSKKPPDLQIKAV